MRFSRGRIAFLLVLVAILLGGGYYAYNYWRGGSITSTNNKPAVQSDSKPSGKVDSSSKSDSKSEKTSSNQPSQSSSVAPGGPSVLPSAGASGHLFSVLVISVLTASLTAYLLSENHRRTLARGTL
jgi:cytoskeletal protein RodZ